MSDSDELIDLPEEEGNDLFGDEDNNEAPSDNERVLSDRDLASEKDDDENHARDDPDMDENQQVKEKLVMDVNLYRHKTPRTKDGLLQSMKVPPFLKWQANEYQPDTFEPTAWDKENVQSENPKGVVRFQRDVETGELRSNAVIYRWSDGSLTMGVGGDHYEMQKKKMVPAGNKPYEEREDAHTYAAAAHFTSDLLVTVGHISEQYIVNLNTNMVDEARLKFANQMAAAARGRRPNGGDMIITATKDPELQKKEAELAEKERMKAQRRRDNAAARLDSRTGGYRSGGLSIGDLEGGRRGTGGSRKRAAGGTTKAKRRRPEYDTDDDLPSGSRRQDEYDREDDFIAPSDDDEEAMSGVEDDEEDDLLDDEEEEVEKPRKKRQKTAEAEDEDADADADADLDDLDVPAPAADTSRSRRRHIIDEDDEE